MLAACCSPSNETVLVEHQVSKLQPPRIDPASWPEVAMRETGHPNGDVQLTNKDLVAYVIKLEAELKIAQKNIELYLDWVKKNFETDAAE